MCASVEFDAGKDDHVAPACLVIQTRTFAVAAFNGEEKFLPAINRSQCAIIAQRLSIWIDERIVLNELLREREKMISFRLGQSHALYLRRKLYLLGEQNPYCSVPNSCSSKRRFAACQSASAAPRKRRTRSRRARTSAAICCCTHYGSGNLEAGKGRCYLHLLKREKVKDGLHLDPREQRDRFADYMPIGQTTPLGII